MAKRTWAPILGPFDYSEDFITFKGAPVRYKDSTDQSRPEKVGYTPGLIMSSEQINGGEISADIKFLSIHPLSSCEIIFYYDPARKSFLAAGIAPPAFSIRHWDGENQTSKAFDHGGDRRNLKANQIYNARVTIQGSRARFYLDNVEVLDTILPFPIPPSQVGFWCFDDAHIEISNLKVTSGKGRVFVIMQFSSPFNEIYEDVIKKVVETNFHLEVRRADEIYGPGVIMADIINDIVEAEFVIAEVTPSNQNVYYELGYAHAIGKPVIMLIDQATSKLPFDVAPIRALHYENTIAGKTKFEMLLEKNIKAILERSALSSGAPLLPGQQEFQAT